MPERSAIELNVLENVRGYVFVMLPEVNVSNIIGSRRSVCCVERYGNFGLADETLDQGRFSFGYKVVAASNVNKPHLYHATLDIVVIPSFER